MAPLPPLQTIPHSSASLDPFPLSLSHPFPLPVSLPLLAWCFRSIEQACFLTGERSAWHCIWQRFPFQRSARTAPSVSSPLSHAAEVIFNISYAGQMKGSMLQYLVVSAVTQAGRQALRVQGRGLKCGVKCGFVYPQLRGVKSG